MTEPITTAQAREIANNVSLPFNAWHSSHALRSLANQLDAANAVILAVMQEVPAGYTPAHTPENLPDRVRDLVVRYAQTDRLEAERDAANAELAALREQVRLAKDWAKGMRQSASKTDQHYGNALLMLLPVIPSQPPAPDQRPATEQKP